MPSSEWTDWENDQIVADYFTMLTADLAGRRYSKAEHNRGLRARIDRGRGSIEYKHQNISAVLKGLGESWIPGYLPAFNFQASLVEAVLRWLDANQVHLGATMAGDTGSGAKDVGQMKIGSPPSGKSRPPAEERDQILAMARRFNVAGRVERNRLLGRAGEERVLAHERAVLESAGRLDLARRVTWVSEEEGDGAGYDIASFSPEGGRRLIEVKTTNGWERTPFFISRNELAVAELRPREWRLLRVWDFARSAKAFELRPPLTAHVELSATGYEATFG